MKKVIKIFRGLAELLGYLSIIVGVIFIVKMKLHYSKSPSTKASYSDVRHVLNWSGIGDANFVSVLNSYESAVQSLDGDHFDAYKIKVKAKEYEALSDSFGGASDWHRLPLDNDVLKDALRLSLSYGSKEKDWLPSLSEIEDNGLLVSFHKIVFYTTHCEFVGLFIYDKEINVLYYIEVAI